MKTPYRNFIKSNINNAEITRSFKEGDIWWAAMGENTDFIFQNKRQTAVVVQAKTMDVSRLYERIRKISKGDYRRIKENFLRLFNAKNMP